MLLTPNEHPELWRDIPGTPNSIGKDVAPELIFQQELSMCVWDKAFKDFPSLAPLNAEDGYWHLWQDVGYLCRLPKVKIPETVRMIIRPRSTLSPRMGVIMTDCASIDPGFIGSPVVLIYTLHQIKIAKGIELFSVELQMAEGATPYNGHYQEKETTEEPWQEYEEDDIVEPI